MPEIERIYNIPIRKEAMKAPRYMRANKAVRTVRAFLQRHMHSKIVKLGPYLNSKILEHGRKNIPHHIQIKAVKEKDIVRAELAIAQDLSFIKPKTEEEKSKLSKLAKKEEIKEEVKLEEKRLSKAEEKKAEIKIEEAEELKREIIKKKPRGKEPKDIEAVKSPRKSLEAETYGRPSKKIQHKKPKKEKLK